ncbi:hypothetical protein [Actinoplanes ianthinogenes]|nr:hypothetical protein [Actinoplanes ianthinogenes]
MLQLMGGVAVAGAVAAGSTAFTANGISVTNLPSQIVAGGETASISVVGASLENIQIVNDVSAPTEYAAIKLTLKDDTTAALTSGTVKVKVTGTTGTSAPTGAGSPVTCTHTSAGVWNCPAGSSKTWTAISALAVTVS